MEITNPRYIDTLDLIAGEYCKEILNKRIRHCIKKLDEATKAFSPEEVKNDEHIISWPTGHFSKVSFKAMKDAIEKNQWTALAFVQGIKQLQEEEINEVNKEIMDCFLSNLMRIQH